MKPRNSKKMHENLLRDLIAAADRDVLAGLIMKLAGGNPPARNDG